MNFDNTFPVILALTPLALGLVWKFSNGSSTTLKSIGLTVIGVLAGGLVYMRSAFETEPSILFLASAILLSGFCVILSQEDTQQTSAIYAPIMIVLGLGLGVLLNQAIVSRVFLGGLLGYIAISQNREQQNSIRTKIIFLHITLAIIFSLGSVFMGDTLQMFASLFLAVTFLPLAPFHFPFVATIKDAKETLSSFWIVVWLVIGLSELNTLYSSLSMEMLFTLSLLALVSAIYASLASLGQKFNSLFVASATVAHVALVWGLLEVFPSFPKWGIPFGITLAFVMGGISLAFSFVRQRYGWKTLGKLPGLASPMPRFGVALVLLVSFALFLPLFPTFSGLMVMPTIVIHDVEIVLISFLFLVVWLGGGWYFLQMLHQTAFGEARSDVPYFDLRLTEFIAVSALLLGAAYSGMIY
jgi:NADH-quinone oxidoreductase subunit M